MILRTLILFLAAFQLFSVSAFAALDIVPKPGAPGNLGNATNRFPVIYGTNGNFVTVNASGAITTTDALSGGSLAIGDGGSFGVGSTVSAGTFQAVGSGFSGSGADLTDIPFAALSEAAQESITNAAITISLTTSNGLMAQITESAEGISALTATNIAAYQSLVVSNGLSARIIATNNSILNLVPIRTFVAGTNIALVTNSSTLTIHGTATGGTPGAITNNQAGSVRLAQDVVVPKVYASEVRSTNISSLTLEGGGDTLTLTSSAANYTGLGGFYGANFTGAGTGLTNITQAGVAGLGPSLAWLTNNAGIPRTNGIAYGLTTHNGTNTGTTYWEAAAVGALALGNVSNAPVLKTVNGVVTNAVAGEDYLPPDGSGAALTGDDEAYDATGWNGDTTFPTKNAVRDKIETLGGGGGGVFAARAISLNATAANPRFYSPNWSGAGILDVASAGIPVGARTLKRLWVKTENMGASTNWVTTVFTNGVASDFVVSINGAGAGYLTGSYAGSTTLTNGSQIAIRTSTDSASAPVASVVWSFYLEME
jgi:hypothetical protein